MDSIYNKKKESKIADAYYRYSVVKDYKTDVGIEDMGLFGFLFLERTENNYQKYIKNIEFNGIKADASVKGLFFSTQPQFEGWLDFVNKYKQQKNAD